MPPHPGGRRGTTSLIVLPAQEPRDIERIAAVAGESLGLLLDLGLGGAAGDVGHALEQRAALARGLGLGGGFGRLGAHQPGAGAGGAGLRVPGARASGPPAKSSSTKPSASSLAISPPSSNSSDAPSAGVSSVSSS